MQLMHNLQIQVGELYRLKIGGGERRSPAFPLTLTTGHISVKRESLQCESNKNSPRGYPNFFNFFPQTVKNFWSIFYTSIKRSYVRWITNFNSIIPNFDEVMPY